MSYFFCLRDLLSTPVAQPTGFELDVSCNMKKINPVVILYQQITRSLFD